MTPKKVLLIFLIILFMIGIFSGLALFYFQSKKQEKTEVLLSQPSPTIEPLATWEDQSEFVFQYPQNIKLDPHPEDQENYTHLELTSSDKEGNIIVWTKDSQAQDLEKYLKINKITNSLESTLGGFNAIKVLNENSGFVLSTIRNGYLYQIEVNPGKDDFWLKVANTIISTYQFNESQIDTPNQQPVRGESQSTGEIFEGEETIE